MSVTISFYVPSFLFHNAQLLLLIHALKEPDTVQPIPNATLRFL